MAVERTAVNPWTWSVGMGFNQGEIVSGHTRTRYCSGQTAMSGGTAGVAPTTTMLEVTRLAIPGQLVELEGTAVA